MTRTQLLDHLYGLPETEYIALWNKARAYLEQIPTVNANIEEILHLMHDMSTETIDPLEWDEAFKEL